MYMLQSHDVKELLRDPVYKDLVKKTVKRHKKDEQSDQFKRMRGVIRANVSATRKAYINAETANPDTPMTEVRSCLLYTSPSPRD